MKAVLKAAGVLWLALATVCPAATVGVRREAVVTADGVGTVYSVISGLAVVGSDSVYLDGRLLGRASYTIDYGTGNIIFWFRPAAGAAVRVTFRRVEFRGGDTEKRFHQLPPPETAPVETGAARPVERPIAAGDTARGLDISGSKTVGVSFGGADGGLDQATRVTVTGQVEGVAVEAELSDQSSPIAPEGTTRDIEELDKLLISLRGRSWRGSFGDVELGLPTGAFGTVERKAVGATVSGEFGPGPGIYAGYASPKGLFGRVELAGVDGSQGPYVLAPDGRGAQLVPGSEQVFLDGARMTRGWDADYTVDYSTGELVFTNRRIIGRLSRIEVTFQYVTGDYSRAVATAGATWARPGVNLRLGLFREADDPERNLTEDLTPEERAYLGTIGDDTSKAWLDGARFAGAGKGDYRKEAGHFVYAGRDSGDWLVRFTLVGDGVGDYTYDDTLLAYRFAGARAGNYVPRVRITLPGRDDFASAAAAFAGAGFGIDFEGLFRQRRLNLFSGASPENGGALNIEAGWQDSSYGATWRHRVQGRGVDLAGARPSPDFTYRWGGSLESERNFSDELLLRARPTRSLDLAGEVGRLVRFDRQAVDRYFGSATAGFAHYEVTKVSDVLRQDLALTPTVSWLFPRAGWQSQSRPNERTVGLSAGLDLKPGKSLSAGAGWRQTDLSEFRPVSGRWLRASRGRLYDARVDWSGGNAIRLGAVAGLNEMKNDSAAERDWSQLLAALNGTLTPRAGLRLQADFSQSYRKVQLRDEVFRYVGAGQGSFRRDSVTGGYLPDPEGDYERLTVATGRFADARDWSVNSSGEVSTFTPVSVTGSFSRSQSVADSGLLTDFGRYDVRVVFRTFEPAWSPTVGYTHDNSLDRTLSTTGKVAGRDQAYAEVFSEALPGTEVRGRIEGTHRYRRLLAGLLDYDENGWRAEVAPVIGRGLRLEVEAGYERMLAELPVSYPGLGRFSVAAANFGLARAFSVGLRTKARASVAATRRAASVAELPFEIGLDQPLGLSPSVELSFEHGFSDVLSASVRYRFSDRWDRAADHVFSAQVKAYF